MDAEDYRMSMGLAERMDKQAAKQQRYEELIQLAALNGKPICIGVWGPTGQRVWVSVESREGTDA